ncbi:MAG: DedA family protein [Actinomycetota bacterium]|nr:DedA family protein [Actinomycetota bacterium]
MGEEAALVEDRREDAVDPVSWLEHVAKSSPELLLIVVVLVMFVDSLTLIGALLPGDLMLLVPAAAVGSGGAPTVVVGAVIGTVLGYTVSYAVGRVSGPAIRHSWLGRWVGSDRWMQAERLLRGPAGRTLALVQFMPMLNYLVPLLAGTLRVPLKRFVLLITAGSLVYSSFYVSLGVLAAGTGQQIGDSTGRLVALLAVSVVVAVLSFTVLAAAVRRMAEEDPVPAGQVDGEPRNVADSLPC